MIRAGLDGEAVQDPDVERFLSWARMSVAWSQKDLGGPVGAVMHLDEENGHCHILRPLQVDPGTGIASLSFWRPGAAATDLRAAARAEGRKLAGSEVFAVGKAALREVATDYHAAVGVHFGHELKTTTPRKRIPYREQKALTERDRMVAVEAAAAAKAQAKKDREALVKAIAERDRALAEARSLSARLATALAEVEALKKAARLLLDRSKRWIAALRGDADAKRILVADPAPRIDGALFDDRTPSLDAPAPRRGRAA